MATETTPTMVKQGTREAPWFETRVGISAESRRALVKELNARLADAADLHSLTKQAHWNVKGMDFQQLHELFDELADVVRAHVDSLAERVTALGGTALGTVRMAAEATTLDELPVDLVTGEAYVRALADRYGAHGNRVREAVRVAEDHGDVDTADLFTEISREVDKSLYFLESHLVA